VKFYSFFCSTRISEERFWRNYFYRVSLIKQSTQLTSLAAAGKLVLEVGNVCSLGDFETISDLMRKMECESPMWEKEKSGSSTGSQRPIHWVNFTEVEMS